MRRCWGVCSRPSDAMIEAYETRIKKLETDKAVLVEKSGQSLRPMRHSMQHLERLRFISNPHKLWSSGRLCDRRAVLKLAFPREFQYHRNTGLRTVETPLLVKVLGGLSSKRFQLAEREGFEPSVRLKPYARFPGVYLKPLGHLSYLKECRPGTGRAQRINQNQVSGNFSGTISENPQLSIEV
jgi:hypothetical protein